MTELNNKGLVLVDFFATWCPPCKMLSPLVEKAKEEYKDYIEVIKVNVDVDTDLADKFQIYSVPTLVLLKDGVEVDRSVGYIEYENLLAFIGK